MIGWIQVIAWVLPLIAVLTLRHKWLALTSVILGFDILYQITSTLIWDCHYCGIYDGTISLFASTGYVLLGFIALWMHFRHFNVKNSTLEFYVWGAILVLIVCYIIILLGHSISTIWIHIIPFVIQGPFLILNNVFGWVLGLVTHGICAIIHRGIGSRMKSHIILGIFLVLYYGLSIFIFMSLATI